jgi:hypothetical protein
MIQLTESNLGRKETPYQEYCRFSKMLGSYCDNEGLANDAKMRTVPLEDLLKFDKDTSKPLYPDEMRKLEDLHNQFKVKLTLHNLMMLDTVYKNQEYLKTNYSKLYQNWTKDIGVTKGIVFYWSKVTGEPQNGKLVKDKYPNRDWTKILTPGRLRLAADLTKDWCRNLSSLELITTGTEQNSFRKTNFAPFPRFEKSAVIPVYSHGYNVVLAQVLRNDGFNVETPEKKNGFDFDLVFTFGDPMDSTFEKDTAEIKFAAYNGPKTYWKGGKSVREGEFILVAVEGAWEQIFIATTRLKGRDWESAGRDGTHCHVAKVLENHRKELQYAAGNLQMKHSGGVEINMVPFPLVSVK